jgi:hypothetical protein
LLASTADIIGVHITMDIMATAAITLITTTTIISSYRYNGQGGG